jgi:histone-lysine N-methyltransferase SETMAR
LDDRRVKLLEIADMVNISKERVFNILHQHLEMNKLCARWVPRLLTDEQKQQRKDDSAKCLEMYRRNPSEFLRRYITVDETWIHHYTPETKEQSRQWTNRGEPTPKKAKTILSAGKVMATVFWDSKGLLYVDYLQKGRTINAQYYADLLQNLSDAIKEKRPHLFKKKILLHQDNAPVHTAKVAMGKIKELHFELLPHPPYSPDLAPCDFHLFANLKKWLGGQKYSSNTEVIEAVNGYFEGLDESYFRNGIMALEKRWAKCVDLEGTYVEK